MRKRRMNYLGESQANLLLFSASVHPRIWVTCVFLMLTLLPGTHRQHVAGETLGDKPVAIAAAAESQDWSQVRQLIPVVDVNVALPDGMTALHWSVHHRNLSIVNELLEAGANPNARTAYDMTPLCIASTAGDAPTIAALIRVGADVTATISGQVTPLLLAARNGDAMSVRTLLSNGAKWEMADRAGQTPLMWAAEQGNLAAVDELLAAGADPNTMSKVGFTAMMFAARDGQLQVVQRLLIAGVDPNIIMQPKRSGKRVPRKGTSALTLAVESGHFELAMKLVEAGADPNDQRSGYAPLHAVSWVRKPNRGEEPDGDPAPRGSGKLTSLEFVRAIVAAGADVNAQLTKVKKGKGVLNTEGATPLLLAGKTADLPLIKLLIELGADAMTSNADGCTPLMAAAGIGVRAVGEEAGTEQEVQDVIDYFVAQGLSVNTIDKNKETAMHGAAYRNFPKVVRRLAEHGADSARWNHKNKYGWTPIMIAQGHRPGSFKPSPETVAALKAAL